jgi:DNA repair protein RadC
MQPHDGHRQRTRNRFLRHGLDNFDDHNVLELLLFYAIPRQDTNLIAHALINQFGSLNAVFDASEAELRKVEGLGQNAVVLLRLMPQICRRYLLSQAPPGERLDTTARAARYLIPLFIGEREEVIYTLCLGARRRVICCCEVARGVVNAATVNARRIAELALEQRASGVILSHNHLSGIVLPSAEDETATYHIQKALALVGVELLDHIIVAGCDYISMAESGVLRM